MDMTGKVVLVTGGGSGMGRLACQLMSRRGARVLALDVNEQGLAETAAGDAGIVTRLLDVTDFAAVDAALREAEATLGPVHRVYNAAAIMPLGKLLEQDNATVHRIMAINYGGLVNIAQAALPAMIRRGAGEFVSFSSLAGWIPMLRVGAYNASKFAVSAFTEVLYHENRASGLRFACVCPPPVATPVGAPVQLNFTITASKKKAKAKVAIAIHTPDNLTSGTDSSAPTAAATSAPATAPTSTEVS